MAAPSSGLRDYLATLGAVCTNIAQSEEASEIQSLSRVLQRDVPRTPERIEQAPSGGHAA